MPSTTKRNSLQRRARLAGRGAAAVKRWTYADRAAAITDAEQQHAFVDEARQAAPQAGRQRRRRGGGAGGHRRGAAAGADAAASAWPHLAGRACGSRVLRSTKPGVAAILAGRPAGAPAGGLARDQRGGGARVGPARRSAPRPWAARRARRVRHDVATWPAAASRRSAWRARLRGPAAASRRCGALGQLPAAARAAAPGRPPSAPGGPARATAWPPGSCSRASAALARRSARPVGHALLDARLLVGRQLREARGDLEPLVLARRVDRRPVALAAAPARSLLGRQRSSSDGPARDDRPVA